MSNDVLYISLRAESAHIFTSRRVACLVYSELSFRITALNRYVCRTQVVSLQDLFVWETVFINEAGTNF